MLTVKARLDTITTICKAVGRAAQEAGFDERTAYACELAVCEAAENIVVHGYKKESDGTIDASITSRPGQLTVELRDRAQPFDPTTVETEPPDSQREPTVGGLGLYIVHQVMDEINYERKQGENRLVLRKSQDPTGG